MNRTDIEELLINAKPSALKFIYGENESYIKEITHFLDSVYQDVPNKQRIYHIRNKVYTVLMCPVCNINPMKWSTSVSKMYVTCSKECSLNKTRNTQKELYGGSYLESDEFKKKMLEAYGEVHVSKTKYAKDKVIATNIKKYGVDNVAKASGRLESFKKTSMKNYGVEHPSQSKEIKSKISKWADKNKDRVAATNRKNCEEKYGPGVTNAMMSDEQKLIKKQKDIVKANVFENYHILDIFSHKYLMIHNICGHKFELHQTTVKHRHAKNNEICVKCNPLEKFYSCEEKEVLSFLQNIYTNKIVPNTNVVSNYEFDIYLPEMNLAIDYNGLYWHSDKYKSRSYHKNKSAIAAKAGITLIHVWADHWLNKPEIIKSILSQKLGINKKLGARKCEIKQIKNTDSIKDFMNSSHLQGYIPFKIGYGLYDNGELLQIMTFSKNADWWEISRLCSKPFINIVGGTKRLYNRFLQDINPLKVMSYCNIDYFDGKIYESLGLKFEKHTEPSFFYTEDYKSRIERHHMQKHKLIELGYSSSMSESQITKEMGLARFYNCGNKKYSITY